MSDDMWWPWPPTEYFTQKEEFERDLSDQMRRMIGDLDRIFPLLMAPSLDICPLFFFFRPLLNSNPSTLDAGQRKKIAERYAAGESMAEHARDYEVQRADDLARTATLDGRIVRG